LFAWFATCDGDVVEGFAAGREKEGLWVLLGEEASRFAIGRYKAITQFGQDCFQRAPKAVQNADAVFQRNYAAAWIGDSIGGRGGAVGFGVDEEGGAPSDVGLEQANAGIRGVPAANDDVVEFIAKKLVDDGFIAAVDFEEVCQRADGSGAILALGVSTEDVANGVGGVAMLTDKGFERAATTIEGCGLAAKLIAATARLRLFETFAFDGMTKVEDLSLESLEAFGDALEDELYLAALLAESVELCASCLGFGFETLVLTVKTS
jgi:hypothetical protein